MQPIMYELPDRRDVKRVVITKSVVSEGKAPRLILKKDETKKTQKSEEKAG